MGMVLLSASRSPSRPFFAGAASRARAAPSPAQEALDLFSELLEISAGSAAAARTGDHHRRERAQAHGLQQFLSDRDLARPVPARVRGERDANRVADTLLE